MTKNFRLALILMAALAQTARAQDLADYPRLPRDRFRSGQSVLNAFAPVSAETRGSIVELNVKEDTVALAAIVDSNGLALTKASEIKPGKLTCWLASGKEVEAQLLAVDDDNDVALVRIKADGLKPIQWENAKVVEGEWAITPGLADTPQAVGIISTLPHRILSVQRAFMGVKFDIYDPRPMVRELSPGFGAEVAGVLPGDVILAVQGSSVTNSDQVKEMLRDFHDGQTVHIRFQRKKKEFDAEIRLMAPKPGDDSYFIDNPRENRMSGDISVRSQGFEEAIEHDTVLEPWQCGGPLLDLDGKAIGLNIARASRFATYALPASLAQEILARLKAKIDEKKP